MTKPFTPPRGPGRCLDCGWHTTTQGHAPDCFERFCPGCGYYRTVYLGHREDCTQGLHRQQTTAGQGAPPQKEGTP